jgi:hypothetical protein
MLSGLARSLNATMSDRSHCRRGTHPTRRADPPKADRSGVIDVLGARRGGRHTVVARTAGSGLDQQARSRGKRGSPPASEIRLILIDTFRLATCPDRSVWAIKDLAAAQTRPDCLSRQQGSDVPTVPQGLTCLDAHVRTGISPAGSPITLDITSSQCY